MFAYSEFKRSLKEAKVGQCVVYYSARPGGSLATQRLWDDMLDRIAKLAFCLSELGYVRLCQRKTLTGTDYEIYIKRKLIKAGSSEEGPITEAERLATTL